MPVPIGSIGRPMLLNTAPTANPGTDPETERRETLKDACRDFESLFINYMLQQMRQTVPKDGLFRGGQAEQMYTSMMDSEIAKEMSRQRGLGLAPIIYNQMAAAINDETKKK